MAKRINPWEASQLFTVEQGDPIDKEAVDRLVKRGLVCVCDDRVFVSPEGRDAFKKFMGTDLVVAPRRR